MSKTSKKRKPRGRTGAISVGPTGISRKLLHLPDLKDEIELVVANAFCAATSSVRPQIQRYLGFTNLQAQSENSIDFRVETQLGLRWLELAEFAPLHAFGGKYDNVPAAWSVDHMAGFLLDLILKKNEKGYGSGVILVIYKTHETLFVPPPIIRSMPAKLAGVRLQFESIYFVSLHNERDASAWEVWPGSPNESGTVLFGGTVHVGFDS